MFKYLYLVRHASSLEKQIGQTDKERDLSNQGTRDAIKLGQYLAGKSPAPEVIFCSPALRAKNTATLIIDAAKISSDRVQFEEALYEASFGKFLDIVRSQDDAWQAVMYIGHNPTLSYVTEYLTASSSANLEPGSMAIIQFDLPSWNKVDKATGELVEMMHHDR